MQYYFIIFEDVLLIKKKNMKKEHMAKCTASNKGESFLFCKNKQSALIIRMIYIFISGLFHFHHRISRARKTMTWYYVQSFHFSL